LSGQLSEQHIEGYAELDEGDLEPVSLKEASAFEDLGGILEATCSTAADLEQTVSYQPDPLRVDQNDVYEIVVRYPSSSLSLLYHVGKEDLGNATLLCYADVYIINPVRRTAAQSIEPDLSSMCRRHSCSPEDLSSVKEEVVQACEASYKVLVTLPLLVDYSTETDFIVNQVRLKPPKDISCPESCSSVVSMSPAVHSVESESDIFSLSGAENYFKLRTSAGFEWAYDPTKDAKEVGVLIPNEMKAAAALELLRTITHAVVTDPRARIQRRGSCFLVKK
jgi:hypothetical protein